MKRWGLLIKNFNKIKDSDIQEDAGSDDLFNSWCTSETESGEEKKGCSTANQILGHWEEGSI